MKTIIFINNKGGVGKTATVTNVAHILAEKHKKKVLVIDLDPQMNTTTMFMDLDFSMMFNQIVDGKTKNNKEDYEYSVEDLLLNPDMDIHDAISKTAYKNLDMIPAHLTLSFTESRMASDVAGLQQFILRNHLKTIKDEYDYCIVDTSPSLSLININGLVAADEAYMPMNCDGGSMLGIANTLTVIKKVQEYCPNLFVSGIFFTRYNRAKNVSKFVHDVMDNYFKELLLPVNIGVSKQIEEGSMFQQPLLVRDPKEKEKVTQEYMELVEIIVNSDKENLRKGA